MTQRHGQGHHQGHGPGHDLGPDLGHGAQASGPDTLLELVDEHGRTVGTAGKHDAHRAPGRLHRAFSVFLLAPDGRMLLQRRAGTKYHSPGVWSNACCGHPLPGEAPARAAARRTGQELGLQVAAHELVEVGQVLYRHLDPASGLVEHERTHVFTGVLCGDPRPDPGEVGAVALVDPPHLARLVREGPVSVWFGDVLRTAVPALDDAGRCPAPPRGAWADVPV